MSAPASLLSGDESRWLLTLWLRRLQFNVPSGPSGCNWTQGRQSIITPASHWENWPGHWDHPLTTHLCVSDTRTYLTVWKVERGTSGGLFVSPSLSPHFASELQYCTNLVHLCLCWFIWRHECSPWIRNVQSSRWIVHTRLSKMNGDARSQPTRSKTLNLCVFFCLWGRKPNDYCIAAIIILFYVS